jgi:hypothetical protein
MASRSKLNYHPAIGIEELKITTESTGYKKGKAIPVQA